MPSSFYVVGIKPEEQFTLTRTDDAIQRAVMVANLIDNADKECGDEVLEPNEVFIYKAVLSVKIIAGEEHYTFYRDEEDAKETANK